MKDIKQDYRNFSEDMALKNIFLMKPTFVGNNSLVIEKSYCKSHAFSVDSVH